MRVLIPILLAALVAGCNRTGAVHIDDVVRAQDLCNHRKGLRAVTTVRMGLPKIGSDQSIDIQIHATCWDGAVVTQMFRQAPVELAREGS